MRPCARPRSTHVAGVKHASWLSIFALARVAPPHATCVAEHDEHTGITWWFEDRDTRIELGWGYDGAERCILDHRDGRYLATWVFWDPYGLKPELRTAVVADGRRIAQDGQYIGPYMDVEPVAVTSEPDGWLIDYRAGGDVHRMHADRDGQLTSR